MISRVFRSQHKSDDSSSTESGTSGQSEKTSTSGSSASKDPGVTGERTAKNMPQKKGKPTPRRRDQERARGLHTGPVTAPTTRAEAKARRKAAEAGMTKDQRKAHRAELKAEREERRQLMIAGDDRYVLARDRGEVRRFARDWVDTHRRLINYFMPIAFVVVFLQLVPYQPLITYGQLLFMVLLLVIIIDGVLIGRAVNAQVRERFPDSDDHGFGLGWYAAMRATQPRPLRTPRPRLSPRDSV